MAKYRTKHKINGVPIRKYKRPKDTYIVTFTGRVELHDMPSKQGAIGWVVGQIGEENKYGLDMKFDAKKVGDEDNG